MFLNGEMENRNGTRLIRQFIKTILLSEQRKHGLFVVCDCARPAEKVTSVDICTQCMALLALSGSVLGVFVALPNLFFQPRASFCGG